MGGIGDRFESLLYVLAREHQPIAFSTAFCLLWTELLSWI